MYPFARLLIHMGLAKSQPPLDPMGIHISHHICWPWDIDMFGEMNHGRILTIFDQGRFGTAVRTGLMRSVLRGGWALTLAGVSVRYRKRVLPFRRYEMRSRAVGMDERFIYLEQSLYRHDECCASALYRAAATKGGRMVPVCTIARSIGLDPVNARVPDWVKAWADADAQRPWPPEV